YPDGSIAFVSSSATVDYLYHCRTAQVLLCSNSLPYLLAVRKDELIEFEPDYARINDSIASGIDRYEQAIPTRRASVNRLIYRNLVIKNGAVRQEAKTLPPEFTSFEEYQKYFADNVAGIIKNARDPARKIRLKVLSTQSTGYDSTAINAVARPSGIDATLSIQEPKERGNYFKGTRERSRPSDSGVHICQHLGLKMYAIDRRDFLKDP